MNKKILTLFILSTSAIILFGCNSGGTTVSSSLNNTTMAYISDFNGNKLLRCAVSPQNGQLINCENIAQANTLNAPTGIAINNGQIYVNNSGFNAAPQPVQSSNVQCALNGNVSTLSSCLVLSELSSISNPIGFTINGSHAYIANYFGKDGTKPGSYTLCSIAPNTANLSNCITESAPAIGMFESSTPEVVTINNTTATGQSVAYITDQQNAGYSFCNVNSANGRLEQCTFESLSQGSGDVEPRGPRQMTIIDGYAYFADSGNTGGNTPQESSAYTLCKVSPFDGSLSACSTQQTSPTKLNSPTGIARNGDYVYITNEAGPAGNPSPGGYSYTMCSIGESGFLTKCNNYVPQGIENNKVGNTWLTYIAFTKNYSSVIKIK